MAVISINNNVVEYEYEGKNRKKKRRKLNILENLYDIGIRLIRDCNFHQIINQRNVGTLLKLYEVMHENNNYQQSVHSRKFQFYSQLIERYCNQITIQTATYLTSSTTYEKDQFEEKNLK
jgi:hypothetical protein